MNELPSLEVKIIPDESELTTRGRKRGPEGDILPPSQKGRKGSARGYSVPPGSDTARARERAEAKKFQEMKGKGSTKGTSKGWGKLSSVKGAGKLPSTFVPVPSTAEDEEVSIEARKGKLMNRSFCERTWGILRSSLIQQGVSIHNLMVLEFTYLHWYQQLEHVPKNVPLEEVNLVYLASLEAVEYSQLYVIFAITATFPILQA